MQSKRGVLKYCGKAGWLPHYAALFPHRYSKRIVITAMKGSVSSSANTPHSFTGNALRGAQVPWVPALLTSSAVWIFQVDRWPICIGRDCCGPLFILRSYLCAQLLFINSCGLDLEVDDCSSWSCHRRCRWWAYHLLRSTSLR